MYPYRIHGFGRRRGSLIGGLIIAAIALFSFFSSKDYNPITGETQYVALDTDQEIAMGLQAAPAMASEYGGMSSDAQATSAVKAMGARLVQASAARGTDWQFNFHLLADPDTVNAFALPGGQVFITEGLYHLLKTQDQLAGVLAHEMGHVVARHGAEHVAKEMLAQGLSTASVVATGEYGAGQMAAVIGRLVNMRYGRQDELESDALGVRFMDEAGYDPSAMIDVMQILAGAAKENRPPEFFSTHPNPENRISNIREAIARRQAD